MHSTSDVLSWLWHALVLLHSNWQVVSKGTAVGLHSVGWQHGAPNAALQA
jgi:hypothetical protein